MNKHFFASLFAVLFIMNFAHAQLKKGSGDIGFSLGFHSLNELSLGGTDVGTFVGNSIVGDILEFQEPGYQRTNYRNMGPFAFSFKIMPYNRLTVGGVLQYESINSDLNYFGESLGNQSLSLFTAALEMDYRYISSKTLQVYFSFGAGTTVAQQDFMSNQPEGEGSFSKSYEPVPSYHVNVLGIRLGKAIGIFGELGFGYKGLLNVGLSFQRQQNEPK